MEAALGKHKTSVLYKKYVSIWGKKTIHSTAYCLELNTISVSKQNFQ